MTVRFAVTEAMEEMLLMVELLLLSKFGLIERVCKGREGVKLEGELL